MALSYRSATSSCLEESFLSSLINQGIWVEITLVLPKSYYVYSSVQTYMDWVESKTGFKKAF